MRKIVFVCMGNICRSVMAEYILKSKTSDIYCESRATTYDEIGNDIYPPAKKCLDAHGIKHDRHYAKRISQDDYDKFDEIYVMDRINLRLINNCIDDKDGKVKMMCDHDIEDPWFTGEFEKVYCELDEATDKLLGR